MLFKLRDKQIPKEKQSNERGAAMGQAALPQGLS